MGPSLLGCGLVQSLLYVDALHLARILIADPILRQSLSTADCSSPPLAPPDPPLLSPSHPRIHTLP
jgi:hypothetical protein